MKSILLKMEDEGNFKVALTFSRSKILKLLLVKQSNACYLENFKSCLKKSTVLIVMLIIIVFFFCKSSSELAKFKKTEKCNTMIGKKL